MAEHRGGPIDRRGEGVTAAELAAALADELDTAHCHCPSDRERAAGVDADYTCPVCRGNDVLDRYRRLGVRPRPPVALPFVLPPNPTRKE